jgi:hypothetical protein
MSTFSIVTIEGQKRFRVHCSRCKGTGAVWATHVFDGVCFKCHGRGVIDRKTKPKDMALVDTLANLRFDVVQARREIREKFGVTCDKAASAGLIGPLTFYRASMYPKLAARIGEILYRIDNGDLDEQTANTYREMWGI